MAAAVVGNDVQTGVALSLSLETMLFRVFSD
jgi:hypothetical protein